MVTSRTVRGWEEGMGYGDFKLLALFGAWFGWQFLPMIILLSSITASLIGIAMIIFKGRDKFWTLSGYRRMDYLDLG